MVTITYPKIIALTGATATGKSKLAFTIAKHFPIEILNMDSALIYRHMNIGTAKPSVKDLKQITHHLIDILEPYQTYSVSKFTNHVHKLTKQINARGKIALLVGGTMMYLHALERPIANIPEVIPNIKKQIRADLLKDWEYSPKDVYKKLYQLDEVTAKKLHPNDKQRIIRALEICLALNVKFSDVQQNLSNHPPLKIPKIILNPKNRELLHQVIVKRFETMLEHGFLQEVKGLVEFFKSNNIQDYQSLPSMNSVGYKQAIAYLDNKISYEQFVTDVITATRRLAKRQNTWLRKIGGYTENKAVFDCFALNNQDVITAFANLANDKNN